MCSVPRRLSKCLSQSGCRRSGTFCCRAERLPCVTPAPTGIVGGRHSTSEQLPWEAVPEAHEEAQQAFARLAAGQDFGDPGAPGIPLAQATLFAPNAVRPGLLEQKDGQWQVFLSGTPAKDQSLPAYALVLLPCGGGADGSSSTTTTTTDGGVDGALSITIDKDTKLARRWRRDLHNVVSTRAEEQRQCAFQVSNSTGQGGRAAQQWVLLPHCARILNEDGDCQVLSVERFEALVGMAIYSAAHADPRVPLGSAAVTGIGSPQSHTDTQWVQWFRRTHLGGQQTSAMPSLDGNEGAAAVAEGLAGLHLASGASAQN